MTFGATPIGSILWHQLLLPLAVRRYNIDVLYTVQNRIPVIKNCPQIVSVLDLADFRVERKYDALRNIYRTLLFKTVVPRADRVVTISESSGRDIEQFLHIPEQRIDVIHLGVGDEYFVDETKEAARQYVATRLGVPNRYILYVGAIEHPNKNLVRLLQAYDQARKAMGVSYDLVFAGPKRYRPEIVMAEIERLGLQGCVHCPGYVPKEDLPYLYAGADIFVYVSLWEGFGLPVLEAMAAGTPVDCIKHIIPARSSWGCGDIGRAAERRRNRYRDGNACFQTARLNSAWRKLELKERERSHGNDLHSASCRCLKP